MAKWSFWGAMSFEATPESNNDSGRARTSLARMTLLDSYKEEV